MVVWFLNAMYLDRCSVMNFFNIDVATFIDHNGDLSVSPGEPDKIIFETPPDV